MRNAISDCHAIDDCKEIADQSTAISAYYRQIKDDESVKKFLQVKLRAWRRIGEILITVPADPADGGKVAAYVRRIQATLKNEPGLKDLSDAQIREALKIAALPADFFEREVGEHKSISSLVYAYGYFQEKEWEASPAGRRAMKLRRARQAREAEEDRRRQQEAAEQKAKQDREQQAENRALFALKALRDEAAKEVGITLDRRDRKPMREVVLLLGSEVHEALRQAAFENRVTMQSILRSGLAMWFFAHGYEVQAHEAEIKPAKMKTGS
jgi:hypothetical protein